MKIKLLHLHIVNFKGIRNLSVDFKDVTNIYGDNATGKTTVFDAFTWLLFGKDSKDRKDFAIKTLDKDNKPIHHLDHEVTGVIDVDGNQITLKRIFREKWVKKRGESEPVFTGHETVFFINDVPLSQGEYQNRISSIVDENIFKLITSTTYFNVVLSWKERRKILLDMAGQLDADSILAHIEDKGITTDGLREALLKNKSLDDYKRELANKRKKIADELKLIPSRIDEVNRSMPEAQDYAKIEMGIETRKESIKSIDAQLESCVEQEKQANELLRQHMKKIYFVESKIQDEQAKIRREQQKLVADAQQILIRFEGEYNQARQKWHNTKLVVNSIESGIEQMQLELSNKRKEWMAINARQADTSTIQKVCPTCNRAYDELDVQRNIDDILQKFNAEKVKQLTFIQEYAEKLKTDIAVQQERLESTKKQLETEYKAMQSLEAMVKDQQQYVQSLIDKSTEYSETEELKRYQAELEMLKAQTPKPDTSFEQQKTKLKAERQAIEQSITDLQRKLADRDRIIQLENRKNELLHMEKSMAQEVANLEREEYAIYQYNKLQMETMERTINSKFKLVSFKLFVEQINGGEAETCETLVEGVPYSDLNTASRINAGLDIINGLTHYYNVYAPVFIDNRESVVQLIETNSQLINLIVSENDKTLRVA